MMQDFDRTLELVDESSNSHGATLAQQAKYMEGMGAKVTQLKNAYEGFIQSLTNNKLIIGGVELLTNAVQAAEKLNGVLVPMAIALLGYGAMQLVQRNKVKQLEFEIGKEQAAQNVIEKERQYNEAKTAGEKEKQNALDKLNNEINEKSNLLATKELLTEHKTTLEKKMQVAIANNDNISIANLENQIKLTDAQIASNESEIEQQDVKIKQAEIEYETAKKTYNEKQKEFKANEKSLKLEVLLAKQNYTNYLTSLRNIAAIIKSIAARIAHAKAMQKENEELKKQGVELDNTTKKLNTNSIST